MASANIPPSFANWFRVSDNDDGTDNERRYAVAEWAMAALLLAMLAITTQILTTEDAADRVLPAIWASSLLIANLVPAMMILVLIARRIAKNRAEKAIAGSTGRYHTRLVGLFAIVAAVPTLLVVLFASLLFQYGVEFWYSDRARGVLENANELALGYNDQSARDVRNESLAMAGDLRDYMSQAQIDSPEFAEGYSYQVVYRQFNESAILERGEDGVLRTSVIVDPENRNLASRVTSEMLQELQSGSDVALAFTDDRIEAVTMLDAQGDVLLYASRASSQLALSQWERARAVLSDYDALSGRTRSLQLRFNVALYLVSLLLLAVALWVAVKFADRMVAPLSDLVGASREVSRGNLATRVTDTGARDEVSMLGRAFNSMTEKLDDQRQALVRANHQLDERRAFMQTVVESVSAGIISVDEKGIIQLMNSSAQELLIDDNQSYVERPLSDVAPFLADVAESDEGRAVVQFRRGNDMLTLAARSSPGGMGQVITFDDITQQLLDQRQAAWSDVARRIAHEIKNPLTPIQLAAERLKRRFGKAIGEDTDTFQQLTETIIRQVGDLRNMVDEFSSFARMPKPVFREENLVDLVRQAVFMQRVANPGITYTTDHNVEEQSFSCDRRQISQAIINLLKNAAEAIETKYEAEHDGNDTEHLPSGNISVSVEAHNNTVAVIICDDGVGLPDDHDHLIEPYMTTREKGTGLGLAIVKKIVEEHFGTIAFATSEMGGAKVTLSFDTSISPDPVSE
ncbi:MAG: ATP-binding protein [Pseudomonadota bacterium]